MNTEKLKQHECRFCKNYTDQEYCDTPFDPCRYQYVVDRPDLPDRWELHPDIADTETTELKTIKPDYEAIMDKYLDTLPSDTARKWASIGFKAGLAVKKSQEF